MTITTEEVERLIEWWPSGATALRSLAVERDALKAEIEKLRAEAVRVAVSCGELMTRNEKLRAALKAITNYEENTDRDYCEWYHDIVDIARAALGEKE